MRRLPFFHRILSPGLMGGILGRLALIGGKFGLEDRLLRLQNEKRQGTEGSTLEREEGTTRRVRWWGTATTHLQKLEESREEVLAKLAERLLLHLEAR